MELCSRIPACSKSTDVQSHLILFQNPIPVRHSPLTCRRRRLAGALTLVFDRRFLICSSAPSPPQPSQQAGNMDAAVGGDTRSWGKVSAVLYDMDGVLCNSEEASRMAAVDVFAEMGVSVTTDDFVPFMGTGEANFLGGVASTKGVNGFDPEAAKKRFFEIYLDKYAKPNSGIGFPGALEIIMECKRKGLKVAVASSADRVKVDANLAASGLPTSLFDVIVSADAFKNLKPAPDIFLAASKSLNVLPSECLVIEDALAGVQAAKAANMRCIALTTTLPQERLEEANPSLIRKDIRNITIEDILDGGNSDRKLQNLQNKTSSYCTYSKQLEEKEIDGLVDAFNASSDKGHSAGWFQGSRRDIVRYGSLGIAVSCLLFTLLNWKAMQYTSLRAILNQFSWDSKPVFGKNKGVARPSRIQEIKSYLSTLESRGSASILPEFPNKLDWLNSAPLQFSRNLKGKIVLLDFWTYCCINCMHVLPDLEFLEKKYAGKPFTVIGVHSAKFDNEKDLESIRNAVLRYNITHPVVNDDNMYLWRELGVNFWPTFVVVGPTGKILAQLAGESHREDLDDLIDAALQFYEEKKLLEASSIPLALEKDEDPRLLTSPLKFPGKLAIDVFNDRLFISDSNHNRIVVTDLDGNFLVQVGSSGEEALRDGSFDDACFNRPQGLAYSPMKNTLYVADTENHALREVDFVNGTVTTIAGNGNKGSDYVGGGKGTSQVLNSPWDVCYNSTNEMVYIAMAGQHQIWEHSTSDGITRCFSGDGFERNLNGSSSASTSFAQPSGISISPADSESSSIRALYLKTGGTTLLAGGDPIFPDNLFRFGDHDGVGSDALFQHPLGVICGSDGQIYITDSYNHKFILIVVLKSSKQHGNYAKDIKLSEPSGIVEARNGRLLIADTNNSIIRYLDLNRRVPVLCTLELKGVRPPSLKPKSPKRFRRQVSADTQIVKVDGGSSAEGFLDIKISVPYGYHFSKWRLHNASVPFSGRTLMIYVIFSSDIQEALSKYDVETDPVDAVSFEPASGVLNSTGSASLHFIRSSSSTATGRLNCKIYYCKEDELCLYQSLTFNISFQQEVSDSNSAHIKLGYTVTAKNPAGAVRDEPTHPREELHAGKGTSDVAFILISQLRR
ncbi:riboflavin kinase [Apostasia shenzhenica]|uniref:Riboflavin kinase n=1 Tax=Apostasia shenzhenica TaxID=1088818 RepID=A0A2I0BB97_9ASPA|nr:riboflavin kinase [Apostasia shenzhenica]